MIQRVLSTAACLLFVIAYDKATRKTYLRTDLRSNENIESLPSSRPASASERP